MFKSLSFLTISLSLARTLRRNPSGVTDRPEPLELDKTLSSTTMSNYGVNTSFVLRGVEDVVFEERPVPEGMSYERSFDVHSLITGKSQLDHKRSW